MNLLFAARVAALFSLACASLAVAEESPSLPKMIACHQALVDRSTGTSQNMVIDAATPFTFQAGTDILFVTESSISVVANKDKAYNGKVFIVALTSEGKESRHQIEVRKKGELGSVCCSDGSRANPALPLVPTSSELSPRTRQALLNELYLRLQTVSGEYQNKDSLMQTATALQACQGLPFKTDIVGSLIKKYQKGTSAYSPGTKSPGVKTGSKKALK